MDEREPEDDRDLFVPRSRINSLRRLFGISDDVRRKLVEAGRRAKKRGTQDDNLGGVADESERGV